ncbi:MAG TPA: hypothetical protein VM865_04110 [Acidobacteriaceae bacterium]|jgi:hypothetical protein|nr:hypothetical protein [Acidobacteriaceae bacterium]
MLEHDSAIKGVAGFRIHYVLSSGLTFYVDDLVTTESAWSQGYGSHALGSSSHLQ